MEADKEYEDICDKISDDFLPYTYYIFNKLGHYDFSKEEEKFIDPEEM